MKVLVLRFSSIGDIVLTSPVLRGLKQQVQGAEVHVATKAAFADLVRFNPHVDKVHELKDDLGDLIRRLCRHGAEWAMRDPLSRPMADWFVSCAETLNGGWTPAKP